MRGGEKVYITGLGAVCCLGSGVPQFWSALIDGACGLRSLQRFDLEGSPYLTGGEVTGLELAQFSECGVSMGAQLAAHAALEALSGLPQQGRDGLSVVLATNFGPSEVIETLIDGEFAPPRGEGGARDLRDGPFAWDLAHVAETVGAGGERVGISLSCSSGNAAIAHALRLVRSGRTEAVLAGGYDSIQKIIWGGLGAMRVMAVGSGDESPHVRPFDKERSGTLFSEGAGVVLIESAGHARRRGAEPLAELAGAGANNNAYHMTHADKEGRATAEAIVMALEDAGLGPEEVGHFNAHGTGTKLNDAIETRAFKTVLGRRARQIPVTSIKGGLGHAMGAASSLEAIACVLTLREGLIPPTINYETPDPECDLDIVAGAPRETEVACVINNSAGIGGCNAALVLTKVD